MATTLEGSTALVTGATAGLVVRSLCSSAALGAQVVVHGRSAERGAEMVQEIQNTGGKARFVAADLADADDVRRLAAEAGPVDILINNAGVYKFGATADTDDAFFDEHVNINLRAPYILVQQLVPGMAERGNGVVVNLSTVAAGYAGTAGRHLWCDQGRRGTADPCLGRRVRPLRRTGERRAGRPNRNPGNRRHPRSHRRPWASSPPSAGPPKADEIANAITFLASPAASYVNGAILQATGGQLAIAP